ncbi:MAG TPA: urease accessory protein UreF [Burkholderiales bacterium]
MAAIIPTRSAHRAPRRPREPARRRSAWVRRPAVPAMHPDAALVRLLQLASPALPVGAYSYSEGLEWAVERGWVRDAAALRAWIEDALADGGARVEAAVFARAYDAARRGDAKTIGCWNAWLTAARESEELRLQSLEMGRALVKLLAALEPPVPLAQALRARPCHFVIAFAVAAAEWGIAREAAALAYLHGWAANLVGAGVKLIPLGQTAGQQLLWDLREPLIALARRAATIPDDELGVANWGQALASMQHETQYSRLFRS